MRITEGHLARHYQGRRGGRGPALLDIAQDHALALLHAAGLFQRGLVFKGGTSLRKFRAGQRDGSPPIWISTRPTMMSPSR